MNEPESSEARSNSLGSKAIVADGIPNGQLVRMTYKFEPRVFGRATIRKFRKVRPEGTREEKEGATIKSYLTVRSEREDMLEIISFFNIFL
jgi:hypothetical protein